MQLIDGRALAKQIQNGVKTEIARLGLTPGLAVILVGNNPASHLYVGLKEKAAHEVGIKFEKYVFEATLSHPPSPPLGQGGKLRKGSPPFEGGARGGQMRCGCQQCVLTKIQELNERADIHGILVQVPLPKNYNEDVVIAQIDPKKDVDGFHQVNLRAILAGVPKICPAVALAIIALIDAADNGVGQGLAAPRTELRSGTVVPGRNGGVQVPALQNKTGRNGGVQVPALQNKKAVLLVNRMEFATPLEYLLEARGAEVEIILRAKEITPEIAVKLRAADVLITARGRAGIVKGNMIKDGAIVIDAGTNKLPDGRTVGDVDFDSTEKITGFITPVPGGVGPMTVAMLLRNTLKLTRTRHINRPSKT